MSHIAKVYPSYHLLYHHIIEWSDEGLEYGDIQLLNSYSSVACYQIHTCFWFLMKKILIDIVVLLVLVDPFCALIDPFMSRVLSDSMNNSVFPFLHHGILEHTY